ECEDVERMWDVLCRSPAEICESERKRFPRLVNNSTRHADPTRGRKGLQPRRKVHMLPINVVVFDDDFSGVYANPKLKAPGARYALVPGIDAFLNRHGTFDRVNNAPKLSEKSVPSALDNAPAMDRYCSLYHVRHVAFESLVRSRLVLCHQPSVFDDIAA